MHCLKINDSNWSCNLADNVIRILGIEHFNKIQNKGYSEHFWHSCSSTWLTCSHQLVATNHIVVATFLMIITVQVTNVEC